MTFQNQLMSQVNLRAIAILPAVAASGTSPPPVGDDAGFRGLYESHHEQRRATRSPLLTTAGNLPRWFTNPNDLSSFEVSCNTPHVGPTNPPRILQFEGGIHSLRIWASFLPLRRKDRNMLRDEEASGVDMKRIPAIRPFGHENRTGGF